MSETKQITVKEAKEFVAKIPEFIEKNKKSENSHREQVKNLEEINKLINEYESHYGAINNIGDKVEDLTDGEIALLHTEYTMYGISRDLEQE